MDEYTVFWIINVLADSAQDAASEAQQYMTYRECQTFHVMAGVVGWPEDAVEVEL